MPPLANLWRSRKRLEVRPINNQEKTVSIPKPKPEPEYVTREQFDALVNAVGVALLAAEIAHERPGRPSGRVSFQLEHAESAASGPERAVLKRFIKAFDAAQSDHFARERQEAGARMRGTGFPASPPRI